MQSQVSKGWVRFFYAAAVFNLIIGMATMIVPGASVDVRIIGVLVFSFGIVYWLVARDPVRFGSTLWGGVIGKLAVVGLLAPRLLGMTMDSDASDPMLSINAGLASLILLGDLIFALGFLAFLFKSDDPLED
jgi:hypothetical protein